MQTRLRRLESSKLLRVVAAVAMFELGLFVAGYLVYWIVQRPGDLDFGSQWAAAYIGIHYGWSRLYDPTLIGPIEAANHLDGFAPFQHPPPDAWLAVPFLLLPLRWAGLIWQALLLAALVTAALLVSPPRRWDRALILLSVAGFQPVLFALGYGTMSPVVFLLLVATLRAMEGGAPAIAGVFLGLTALKPQLTLLTIPVLLAAGYWKTALTAVGVMAALAVASVAVIGVSGTRDYVSFLVSPETLLHPVPWTVKGLVGSGTPSFIATAVVIVAAVAVAIRLRPPPDVALSVGVLASLFVAQHLNIGDFVLWLLPVWIAFRAGRPWWLRAVAAVTWMSGWLVLGVPIACVVCDIALAVAFVVVTAHTRAPAVEPVSGRAVSAPTP
ncbi:MAG TPA: glycosyltransferase family 87 protein [Candidatus Dormibacteraeota bacterium]